MGGKAESEEYVRYTICKLMGWDYYTYEAQPPFFIDEIMTFLLQENERDNSAAQRGNKSLSPRKSGGLKR